MRLLLAATLALASASAIGQDAPAAAIQDFYAAAARLLKTDDCRSLGADICGAQHETTKTLDWSASCRQAAKWRDLGRNYQGDAELVGKYKDANQFWDRYCSAHPDYFDFAEAVNKNLKMIREAEPRIDFDKPSG